MKNPAIHLCFRLLSTFYCGVYVVIYLFIMLQNTTYYKYEKYELFLFVSSVFFLQ